MDRRKRTTNTSGKPGASGRARRTRQIAEWIRQNVILHGRPGEVLPTERELAERAGAARNTVRKALGLLSKEGWLKHTPGHGHTLARPRRRLLHTTGLFFPGSATHLVSTVFFREVYRGIHEAIDQLRRQVLTFFGFERRIDALDASMFWSPNMRVVDSLIALEVFDEALIEQAGRLYPTVCLDTPGPGGDVSSIQFDHPASVRMAYKYLLDLGHRRIGLITRPRGTDPAVAGRLQGFQEAMQWFSSPRKDEWLLGCMHDADAPGVVRRWLAMPVDRRPTAIVVVDVFWAVVAALAAAGVRIPTDLSLVAIGPVGGWWDWAQIEAAAASPAVMPASEAEAIALSAKNHPLPLGALRPAEIRLPAREMGHWGVEEIDRRLHDRAAGPRHRLMIPKSAPGNTVEPVTA